MTETLGLEDKQNRYGGSKKRDSVGRERGVSIPGGNVWENDKVSAEWECNTK